MAGLASVRLQQLLLICTAAIVDQGSRWALNWYLEQHSPVDLIREVLDDDELVRAGAAASYRHANGFDKLILASSPLGHMIKLDIWWPEDPRGQEDIHNHRYNFSSLVLVGELSMEHYELRETGVLMDHFHVESDYQHGEAARGRTDRLHKQGQRKVEKLFRCALPAAGDYYLHHAQLHRVAAAPKFLTATLVFQDSNARDMSEVLRPPQSNRHTVRHNAPFGVAEFRTKLQALLQTLS